MKCIACNDRIEKGLPKIKGTGVGVLLCLKCRKKVEGGFTPGVMCAHWLHYGNCEEPECVAMHVMES